MKRLICISIVLLAISGIYADERPMATFKAQYTAWTRSHNNDRSQEFMSEHKYILQIGEGASYFYDPQTFFVDSLDNDPNGKAVRDKAFTAAFEESMKTGAGNAFDIMRKQGLMAESRYKNQKDFHGNTITVWDSSGGDKYQYEVDMNDLQWEIGDSTTTILGYECNLATAGYHGRKWKAWFATDVPLRDGPWQLCGLPGLIMKADTEDGDYGFVITGLQQCNEPFKPVLIDTDKIFKTKRKSYLKMKDYSRRNRSAMINAMTNGKVSVNADYKGTDDYLETDYHE
ncbi:MAG: GLPGLI family protein [Staphylococcus sp.]|nr:GLPGLI family protein [Staphylococcus sp.]